VSDQNTDDCQQKGHVGSGKWEGRTFQTFAQRKGLLDSQDSEPSQDTQTNRLTIEQLSGAGG